MVDMKGASNDIKYSIERLEKGNDVISIQGWVVLDKADMDEYEAYIAIRNTTNTISFYYAPLYTRWDIASLYGDMRAANSGFKIKIPKGSNFSGPHTVRAVLKSRITGEAHESGAAEKINF